MSCLILLVLTVSVLLSPLNVFADTSSDSLLSSICFLGDSTTNSLRYHGVLPGGRDTVQVWTGAKNTLSMWDIAEKKICLSPPMYEALRASPHFPKHKMRLTETAKDGKLYLDIATMMSIMRPKMLVITLGINGCAMMTKSDFKTEYTRLIRVLKEASPESTLVLNTIYPVMQTAVVKNSDIDAANSWISEIAKDENLPFLNTNFLLKAENGFPLSSYLDSTDGIHWNQDGAKKILEVLLHALEAYTKTPFPL